MLKRLPLPLTYGGMLAVAALVFSGQLAAFTVLLALAGMVRLVILPIHALTRGEGKSSAAKERDTNLNSLAAVQVGGLPNSLYGRRRCGFPKKGKPLERGFQRIGQIVLGVGLW
jgi:hypothetical protein